MKDLPNPLASLLALSELEKQSRGLIDTPREIAQQPETWKSTLDRLAAIRQPLLKFVEDALRYNEQGESPSIILTGAGTSDYIGRSVSRILRTRLGCDATAIPSTELITNMDDFVLPGRQYLLISFSRSGESSEGVAVLEQALERYPDQVRHLLITCNEHGAMARFPGIFTITLDDKVNDRGLAMTSSFSNMVIAGQALAFLKDPESFEALIQKLAEIGPRKIAEGAEITSALAKKNFARVCFLGTGPLLAIAEESSLKVLELNAGRINTLAQSPLGLRHGPMSFVNQQTLVVAYLSGDEQRQQYELDLLEEMKAKQLGADMLIVAPYATNRIRKLTANLLSLELPTEFPDWCLPAIAIVTGQLLGLFCAIENNIAPDTPSSGAISRVVSHVKIYLPAGTKHSR